VSPAPPVVAWLSGAAHAHLFEVDRDHTQGVGTQVGRVVHDDVRAVGVGQPEVKDVVLNVILLVGRLSKPGAKWPLAETPLGFVGREGRRS